jgi:hypothetical protein
MARAVGGRVLGERLEELESALMDYFGAINEAQQSTDFNIKVEIPEMPDALAYLRQIEHFGTPLVSGGMMAQPHIFLMEYAICVRVERMFKLAAQAQQQV